MRQTLILAASWIFLPGHYTHRPPAQPYVEALPGYQTNGFIFTEKAYWEPGYYRVEYRRYWQ